MFKKAILRILPFAAAAAIVMPTTAFAAKTEIKTVKVALDCNIDTGDTKSQSSVDADVSDDRYNVDSVTITSSPSSSSGKWRSSDKPKLKIILSLDDKDKYSWNVPKSGVTVTGADGTVTKTENGTSRLSIYFTMDKLGTSLSSDDDDDDDSSTSSSDYDLSVRNPRWDISNSGIGTWYAGSDAESFKLRLYRDGVIYKTAETSEKTYKFAPLMAESGKYTFTVTAVHGTKYGDSATSTALEVTDDMAKAFAAGQAVSAAGADTAVSEQSFIVGDSKGNYWMNTANGWRYVKDGVLLHNCWAQINDNWYAFDANGYMKTGFHQDGGCYYYLNTQEGLGGKPLGAMVTGFRQITNTWYYFYPESGKPLGSMAHGWVQIDGKYYYFDPSAGYLYAGRMTPDGYYVGNDGIWNGQTAGSTGTSGTSGTSGTTSSSGTTSQQLVTKFVKAN